MSSVPTDADQPERVTQLVATGDITLTDLEICWSCDRIPGRHRKPADYWWQTRLGYWLGLCSRCCAIWRRGIRGDSDLGPLRLTIQHPAHRKAA